MRTDEKDSITLKWGSLKAWELHTPAALVILQQWHDLGTSMSAIAHHDTPEQKELLYQLIDASNVDHVHLDWEGVDVSKEEAKDYIRTYGTEVAS